MESSINSRQVHPTERQAALIETNVGWLLQARALVERIDDHCYASSPKSLEPHRVGSHLRHILEFYDCFFEGIVTSHIDYDARKRDLRVATDRCAAIERIGRIVDFLRTSDLVRGDSLVWVRIEDGSPNVSSDPFLTSSVGRELQSLSSHTIHHFALIAMTLRAHGVEVDPDFGVAPSTLRFQAKAGQA